MPGLTFVSGSMSFLVLIRSTTHTGSPGYFRQGRHRSWCKQAPSLLPAFMGIKGVEK